MKNKKLGLILIGVGAILLLLGFLLGGFEGFTYWIF